MYVSENFNMLSEITTDKEVKKLDCLSITKVINMDIEVASDDKFMRVVAAWEINDENWLRKVEKGWEYGDGGRGRQMLNSVC